MEQAHPSALLFKITLRLPVKNPFLPRPIDDILHSPPGMAGILLPALPTVCRLLGGAFLNT
jgi:hypothetical protein